MRCTLEYNLIPESQPIIHYKYGRISTEACIEIKFNLAIPKKIKCNKLLNSERNQTLPM